MHMTFQNYRTIKRTLMQTRHARPGSHQEQHLNTLAMLICGIVGAQHVQFAQIADHAPVRGRKNESLLTRFRRWVTHKLAYLWVQEVAMFAQAQGWVAQFHRTDRCDLRLFQIGLRATRYARREGKRIPMRLR